MHVTIIGGGAIGLSVAWHLAAHKDIKVTLFSAAKRGEASRASGGMLAPLGEADRPSPALDLGIASLRSYRAFVTELQEESGVDIGWSEAGLLRVARSEEDVARLQSIVRWQQSVSLDVAWLDAKELRASEPHASPDLLGALHSADEKHLVAAKLVEALEIACAARGVRIRNEEIVSISGRHDRVDSVATAGESIPTSTLVIAAGAWSGLVAPELEAFAVEPIAGQLALLTGVPLPSRKIYTRATYIIPQSDRTLLVGTTEVRRGFDASISETATQELLDRAAAFYPPVRDGKIIRTTCGFRPGSPDGMPILGRSARVSNVHFATGHYRNGISLASVTGKLIAEEIVTGATPELLVPFSPARFLAVPAV